MIVIPPEELGVAQLVTTNAPDTAAWAPGTTYARDARVVDDGLEYRSLAVGNVGHKPATNPDWWYPLGTVNKLAAFDVSPRSQCLGPAGSDLILQIRPGVRCTALSLLNMSAASARVRIVDESDSEVLHDETYPLATSAGTYWSWFFEPLQQQSDIVLTGLVPSTRARIELTFERLYGNAAAVGVVATGRDLYVGEAELGFQGGLQLRGKSYIDRNDNPVRPERGHSRTLSGTVVVERQDVNRVMQWLKNLIGVPAVWVLDEESGDYTSLTAYGDFERVAARIDNHATSVFSYDINGYQ